MELLPIETMDDVARLIRLAGYEPEVLTTTVNHRPMYAAHMINKGKPTILITAGVHAGEPSGPYAALALLRMFHTDHDVVIVPVRDPFAWEGYVRALSYAVGRALSFSHVAEAEVILRADGKILFEEEGFVLSGVGDLVFALTHPTPETTGPQDVWRRLRNLVREMPELAKAIGRRRIILPSNLPHVEGCGTFGRAYTVVLTADGELASLHDIFAETEVPPEVQALKQLIDRVKPSLTLDLHEGQGERFYLFAYSVASDLARRLGRALLAGVANRGYPIYTYADLKARVGPDISADYIEGDPGVLIRRTSFKPSGPPITMDGYCWRYGPSFLLETGRWCEGGLARRVSFHVWAVQSAANALDEESLLSDAFLAGRMQSAQ